MSDSRILLAALTALSLPLAAQNTRSLWSVSWSNYGSVPSRTWTSPVSDLEAVDDFDVQGTIVRVVAHSAGCSQCPPRVVSGATVRFYEWRQGGVGALLRMETVTAGTSALVYDPVNPNSIDVTLPTPFVATGRHWLSVQLHFVGAGQWDVMVGNPGRPTMGSVLVRDRLGTNQWTPPTLWGNPIVGDLAFELWGLPQGATTLPVIPCVTWTGLPLQGDPNATQTVWRDVKVFAPDDVFGVGDMLAPAANGYDTFTSVGHWDGREYTILPSPSPGPAPGLVSCHLFAVDGTSRSDLWVGGSYHVQTAGAWVGPQVFAMHWDGQSWTVPMGLPLPTTSFGAQVDGSRVHDILALASNDVWFVGDWRDIQSVANPIPVRPGLLMHWDGNGFAQTLLPVVTGIGDQHFNAIAASAPNDVWVVGGAGDLSRLIGTTVPVVFRFDGASWTHQPCPAPPGFVDIYDVEIPAPNQVIVLGNATNVTPTSMVTTPFMAQWDGTNWTLLPGPPDCVAAKAFGTSLIWAVGSKVWSWDGRQWTEQHDLVTTANGYLRAVDGRTFCELHGVGNSFSSADPFAARQDNPWSWTTRMRTSVQPGAAPCRLTPETAVRPGEPVDLAIEDPAALVVGGNAPTFLLVGTRPAPSGVLLPFGGSNGGPGEVLVDPATIGYVSPPVALVGPGAVARHRLSLPAGASWIGTLLTAQGFVFDSAPSGQVLFTNAADLQVGW